MSCENINCNCGKLLAKIRNGKLYLYCKSCKKEIPFETEEIRKMFIRTIDIGYIDDKIKEKFRAKSQD